MRTLLEPSALHPSFPESKPNTAWESEIEASKAISLKRIADAFDSQSPKGSVLYFLEQIASAANAGRS